jgi:hypothetical protein
MPLRLDIAERAVKMPEPWFHRRLPVEGEGYSVRSRPGSLAVGGFALVVTLGILIPILAGADVWTVYGIAVFVFLCALALLAIAIRRHGDAQR